MHARGSKTVLKKLNWATRHSHHANSSSTGFPEEYPSSGFTADSKDVQFASESALENHTALKLHIRQKLNPLQLPMDSREGSIVSLSQLTRICYGRTGHLQ